MATIDVLGACSGVNPGTQVLACLSSSLSYVPGYMILLIFWMVVYFNLSEETEKIKVAGSTFVTTIIATFLGAGGIVPSEAWGVMIILTIASTALLYLEKS